VRRRWVLIVAALLILSVGGIVIWRTERGAPPASQTASSSPASSSSASSSSNAQPIPATIGTAERKNVDVYLTGLGIVQAFNTVTIKVRVDGTLDKVLFTEGQDVKEGDVLAQIDPRPFKAALDLAQATKATAQASLDNARLDLHRFQTAGTLANTQQQIDTQGALVRQLEATVAADQANVEAAQVNLDYTTIKAPLSGRAGIRLVDQGNIVHATDTTGLVVITQLQPISVIFTLPQDQLQEVIHQMTSTKTPLKVVAQGRDDQRQLGEGQLELVDNLIDQTTGSVRLKATFPNTDYALWPGQYVNIRLRLQTLPQVVTAPSTAVQRGPNGMFVYVVKPDSTVAMQSVDVGQMTEGTSVINKGLEPGTRIVTAGQYRLQPGSLVASTDAATNVASGK
jgi:membrane fusion protein, multidrug efflux system